MTKSNLVRRIYTRKKKTHSLAEQIDIGLCLIETGIGPTHEGLTKNEIGKHLEFTPKFTIGTSVSHLEDCGVVEQVPRTRTTPYVISERLDEIINGRVDEVVAGEIENLIEQVHDEDPPDDAPRVIADGGGVTIRDLLSDEFDLVARELEEFLRSGNQLEKLNLSIDAIEESEEVETNGKFGRIMFRFPANRYRATERAIRIYNR